MSSSIPIDLNLSSASIEIYSGVRTSIRQYKLADELANLRNIIVIV